MRTLADLPLPGRRINVTGVTGSGKTTLARQLAQQLHYPHVELDALHWGPNWTPVSDELFRQLTADALSGDAWTVDGNYTKVRDIVVARIDTLVFLDYPLPLVLWRLLRRTTRRVVGRELLWNNNRERLWNQLSRDSLFLWALKTYRRRKRTYAAVRTDPQWAHLIFVHLRSPHMTKVWLSNIQA